MNFRHIIVSTVVLAAALAAPVFGASPSSPSKDPFAGKWMMDPDKSTFMPGGGPTDRTMMLEMKGDALHHVTDSHGRNGGLSTIEYTAKFDGHDYKIDGTAMDTVSLKRVDPHTIERTGKVKGMQAETCTMMVSPDGKTLTMKIDGNYQGTHYASTQVYKRE